MVKLCRRRADSVIRESDLCLKAPVGETALQTIIYLRQQLNLYANIRPAKNYRFIDSKFQGVDLVIVRENTEESVRLARVRGNGREESHRPKSCN